jgi:exodeoxyribonuclease VII small subunit
MVKEKTAPRPDAPLAPEALPADFESALAELESLAARMNDGDLGLEESIALYQRGVALARVCQQRLDAAEEQVRVLQGQLLEPFEGAQGQDAS